MDYLTPEEEYELQYADNLDELAAMEDECGYYNEVPEKVPESAVRNDVSIEKDTSLEEVIDEKCAEISSGVKRQMDRTEENTFSPGKKRFKSSNDNNSPFGSKTTHTSCKDDCGAGTSSAKLFHYIGVSGDYEPIAITKFDGTVIYIKCYENVKSSNNFSSHDVSGLLQRPLIDMKMEIFSELEKSVIQQQEISAACMHSEDQNDRAELWVEKYQPETYTELLSDEGVNRTLLQWLKLWDKIVFGREQKIRDRSKHSTVAKKPAFKSRKPLMELNVELDEHSRPTQKIVLLCGPPGLGKTTLAKIIARLAGYNVVEMNASDDRSPELFRQRLEACTQMKAMLDKDYRPNCLVIDEIDGAPVPSINLLVSFVKSLGFTKGKKKKGDFPVLKRPIICICNDQYAVALKPLRQVALILHFPPTKKDRLATRIYEVATFEGLKTDFSASLLLCEKLDNDIRSCLSTIQFFAKLGKELRSFEVKTMELGMKDVHKSLFAIWRDIFQLSKTNSFNSVLRAVQSFGDFEKIAIGIHENYLKVKLKTINAENITKGADWLCHADIMNNSIMQNQAFFLMSYLPFVAVAFHILFATTSYTYISYPSAYYEFLSKRSLRSNTLTSLMSDMTSSLKSFINANHLIVDTMPLLVEIIKPLLRPVNMYLYTSHEKAELKRVVDVMIAFNLHYIQERTVEGNYRYNLEPNLEELVCFNDIKRSRELSYGIKQLISREIGIEKMRRSDHFESAKIQESMKEEKVKQPTKPVVVDKPFRDFFGRKIEMPKHAEIANQPVPISKVSTSDLWFHFKEGYSNAVRKTVYMKDLL